MYIIFCEIDVHVWETERERERELERERGGERDGAGLFVFPLLSSKNSLHILDANPLNNIFTFLKQFLGAQKF